MKEKVETALNMIKPALNADGEDVELVSVPPDGVVNVKLTGAREGPVSQMTLKVGIEKTLKEEVPEGKGGRFLIKGHTLKQPDGNIHGIS